MAECYLTVTVKSANPVSFQIGDYIDYRGERYSINYDPTVLKKARKGTYGEGFVYDSIKFVSDSQSKIVGCDFTDIVLDDNQMHYTGLPTFPFYCESVDDLLDRVQACLEELYPGRFILIGLNTARNAQRGLAVGRESDFVNAYKRYVDPTGAEKTDSYGKTSVALSVDNITCWEAITKINSDFGLNFIMRGDVVIAGINGVFTPDTFRYGKGNGLYEIERISEQDQQVITRLKAYGSEENLPTRYYAELNLQVFAHVERIEANYETSGLHYAAFWLDLDFDAKYFTERSKSYPGLTERPNYIVRIMANGITVKGYVSMTYDSQRCHIYCEYSGVNPEDDRDETEQAAMNAFSEAIKQGDTVYFVGGIEKGAFPLSNRNYATENLPNNMSVSRLMLPGFPNKSLYDWVKEHGGTDCDDERGIATINGFTGYFSKDKHRPWLQSLKAEDYGIRPGNIYFDGNNDTENIHPTLEGMKYAGHDVDVIAAAEQITDNGVYGEGNVPNFTITLPILGFDLAEVFEEGATIDMKDGMCGSRSFKMASRPTKNSSGQWECKVERVRDDSLDLWFPYKDFQIKAGDHYVLTGIKLPDEYVSAASEKLFDAAIEALQKNDTTRFTYQPRIDEIWMARQHDAAIKNGETSLHDTLHAGDIFLFKDDDLCIDEGIIIDVLTIRECGNDGIPTYEVTLRNEKQVSSIQRMIDKTVGSNASGGGAGGGGYTSRQIQSLIENYGGEKFLSRKNDDTAKGCITVLAGLRTLDDFIESSKGGALYTDEDTLAHLTTDVARIRERIQGSLRIGDTAATETEPTLHVGGNTLVDNDIQVGGDLDVTGRERIDRIQSHNYSGSGLADTGYMITSDDGTGSSMAVLDYLTIRKKMIVNSIEVKETHFSAGDIAHTLASCEIARTDYLYVDENGGEELLGYSRIKVPWLLRGAALVLGVDNGIVRGLYSRYKRVRLTLTEEQLRRCNRIRCYFLSKDGDREIENWFRPNDLVRCQTWNVVRERRETFTPDFNDHAGNVYYWRKIHDVSWNTGETRYVARDSDGQPTDETTTDISMAYINEGGVARLADNGIHSNSVDGAHAQKEIDCNTYHWFDVDYDYAAEQAGGTGSADKGSDIPAAGDKVVQFGNTTDPDRMNIYLIEVNGAGNPDAPDWKMYRGVYTFNLSQCWWGGESCMKTKWSVSTGIEAYAPSFKWITEYGRARQVITREEGFWSSIALERDDWSNYRRLSDYPDYSDDILDSSGNFVSRVNGKPKNWVRKCRYYDQVAHNGSAWLCSRAESFYWRDRDGNMVSSRVEGAEYVRDYTTQEPSAASNDWTEQVGKGDPGAFKSQVFCRSNSTPSAPSNDIRDGYNSYDNPVPPAVSGQPTWTDGAPGGTAILWMSTAWFYSDGKHSDWTTPRQQTDTETLDVEFSPNATQPSTPAGTAADKDTSSVKAQRHAQGWYDPNDTLPTPWTWSDMVWRAERRIRNGVYYGNWTVSRIKGENSVRIDLSNENDTMLYSSSKGLVSGSVQSTAYLFDGSDDVSDGENTTWQVSASGCTLTSGNSRNIVVTDMTEMTAKVTVTATYTDRNKVMYTRSTQLTLKKIIDGDKYDLDITPSSIAYNVSKDSPATSDLTIRVWRTAVDGTHTLSEPPSGYYVYAGGTRLTASSTGIYSITTDNSAVSGLQVMIAKSADGTDTLDSETIPVVKAEDGKTPTISIGTNGHWIINGTDTGVTAEGKDGTGVAIKGTVASTGKMTIENGMGYAVPMKDDGTDGTKTQAKHGDCYICDSNRHLYMFTTSPSVAWNDLGEFKGKPGQSSYMHIAWADKVTFSGGSYATIEGFIKVYDGNPHDWVGFATDNNSEDPSDWKAYKWNYQRGADGSGTEYVYLLTKEGFKPTLSQTSGSGTPSEDEFLPAVSNYESGKVYGNSQYFEDDPPASVSAEWQVLWWACRKYKDGAWQEFGDVTMHNRYSKDGMSVESYIYTEEAWSNQDSTVNAATPPSDCQESDWSDSTPANVNNRSYLWRRSRKMTLKADKSGYDAGQWAYTRLSGTNGTSIKTQGTVAATSKLLDKEVIPLVNGADGARTAVEDGWAYVCQADRHLYQWSDETRSKSGTWTGWQSGWLDLGEFKGESGKTYYTHVAWARGITIGTPTADRRTGQRTTPNASACEEFSISPQDDLEWMGVLVDEEVQDAAGADGWKYYTWNKVQGIAGENSVRLALDNEHEDFLYDGTTLVAPSAGASSPIRLYDGGNDITASMPAPEIHSISGTIKGASGAYIDGKTLYVKSLTASTCEVVVKCDYNGTTYYAKFTANKTNQDKYDIVCKPSSIAYNSTTHADKAGTATIQTVSLSATGIGIGGTNLSPSLSTSVGAGRLCVFWAYVSGDGTVGSFSGNPVTSKAVTKQECESYVCIYFELRYYTSSSDYRICDYETVEIAKTKDGDSIQGEPGDDGVGLVVNPSSLILNEDSDASGQAYIREANNTATIRLYEGGAAQKITVTEQGATNYTWGGNELTGNGTSQVTMTLNVGNIASGDNVRTGSIALRATSEDGNVIDFSVPFYVNRLQTFSRVIDKGVETALGEAHVYEMNPDGTVKDTEYLYKQVNSAKEAITTLQDTVGDASGGLVKQVSTLEQTAQGITSRVSRTEEKVELLSNKEELLDLTGLDPSKAYPVTINLRTGNENTSERIMCGVERPLNASYNAATSPDYYGHDTMGFMTILKWTTFQSGWGAVQVPTDWSTEDEKRYIDTFDKYWLSTSTAKVAGSIGQVIEVNKEFVYLRGGSKYRVYTSKSDAEIELHPSGVTLTYNGGSRTLSVINASDIVEPVQDRRTKEQVSSEIRQTADSISLSVRSGIESSLRETGIDIVDKIITMKAEQTIFKDLSGREMISFEMVEYDGSYLPSLVFWDNKGKKGGNKSFVLNWKGLIDMTQHSASMLWGNEVMLGTSNGNRSFANGSKIYAEVLWFNKEEHDGVKPSIYSVTKYLYYAGYTVVAGKKTWNPAEAGDYDGKTFDSDATSQLYLPTGTPTGGWYISEISEYKTGTKVWRKIFSFTHYTEGMPDSVLSVCVDVLDVYDIQGLPVVTEYQFNDTLTDSSVTTGSDSLGNYMIVPTVN